MFVHFCSKGRSRQAGGIVEVNPDRAVGIRIANRYRMGRLASLEGRGTPFPLGQGMLAVTAAEYAKAGKSIEETIAVVRALIPETRTYGLLQDLRYAVRGGRVPRWVKTLTDLLRANAIIYTVPDGRVASGSFLLGRRNRISRFARYVAKRTPAAESLDVAVGHALCPDDAVELERELQRQFDNIHRTTITDIGAALGVHCGPGSLVVATQPYTRPD